MLSLTFKDVTLLDAQRVAACDESKARIAQYAGKNAHDRSLCCVIDTE